MSMCRLLVILTASFLVFVGCKQVSLKEGVDDIVEPGAKIEFSGQLSREGGIPVGVFSFENLLDGRYELRSVTRETDGSVYCTYPSFEFYEDGEWSKIDITYAGVVDLTAISPHEKFTLIVPLDGLLRVSQKKRYKLIVDEMESQPFTVSLDEIQEAEIAGGKSHESD